MSHVVTRLPIGMIYATWSGLGIAAITIIGVFKYDQIPNIPTIFGLILIIVGVIIVNTMNDIKDSEIDKTAHPNRPIHAQRISIEEAKKFTWILWTLSIGSVIFLQCKVLIKAIKPHIKPNKKQIKNKKTL